MKRGMRYALLGAVVGTFSLFSISESQAQACVGFGNTAGQVAAAFTTSFPTGGNAFGVEAGYNFVGPLAVFGGISVNRPDSDLVEDFTSAGAGVAFDLPALGAVFPIPVQACPTVAIRFANIDVTDFYSIPIGIGFATTLPVGEALALSPYIIPQINLFRGPGGAGRSDFLLELGALLGFAGNFYAGANVNRLFLEEAESVFGLKIGVVF
jgi:hypothetical protein